MGTSNDHKTPTLQSRSYRFHRSNHHPGDTTGADQNGGSQPKKRTGTTQETGPLEFHQDGVPKFSTSKPSDFSIEFRSSNRMRRPSLREDNQGSREGGGVRGAGAGE